MTVTITDYTPGGKDLASCTPVELLKTVNAIDRHGALRMHASNRLMGEIQDECESRGLGLFDFEGDIGPGEEGFLHAIGTYQPRLEHADHWHALTARDNDHERHVFTIDGPLTPAKLAEIRAVLDRPKTVYPQTPLSPGMTAITGLYVPNPSAWPPFQDWP